MEGAEIGEKPMSPEGFPAAPYFYFGVMLLRAAAAAAAGRDLMRYKYSEDSRDDTIEAP